MSHAWQPRRNKMQVAPGPLRGPVAPKPRLLVSDPDDFEVIVLSADGEAIVCLVGAIDLSVRDQLDTTLTQASDTTERLVVDLSRTTFIDSTGLKALVDVWRRRADARLELVLRDPAPVVTRTLEIAGLTDQLPIDVTNRSTDAVRSGPGDETS